MDLVVHVTGPGPLGGCVNGDLTALRRTSVLGYCKTGTVHTVVVVSVCVCECVCLCGRGRLADGLLCGGIREVRRTG